MKDIQERASVIESTKGKMKGSAMGSIDGGFINERTGAYVSEERAHQHVGEDHAFGGYAKARSKKTGNFYMRETDDDFEPVSTSFAGILSRDGRSGQR